MSNASANSSTKTSNKEVELEIPFTVASTFLGVDKEQDKEKLVQKGDKANESLFPELTISSVGTYEIRYDKNGNLVARIDEKNEKIYTKASNGEIKVKKISRER